jgi:hypothetical protein
MEWQKLFSSLKVRLTRVKQLIYLTRDEKKKKKNLSFSRDKNITNVLKQNGGGE